MRLFHCKYCDHYLRFGKTVCSSCYMATPLYNRRIFWVIVILAAFVGILSVAATVLAGM